MSQPWDFEQARAAAQRASMAQQAGAEQGVVKLCECGCGRPAPIAAQTDPRKGAIAGQPRRFIHGHNGRLSSPYTVDDATGCWVWNGVTHRGYGDIVRDGVKTRAHRYMYERLVGPVPEGLVLDHLCRNRACVNPAHLEPVTVRENVLRGDGHSARNSLKTQCPEGHPLSGANLYVDAKGKRSCKECRRQAVRRYRAKRRHRVAPVTVRRAA